MPVKAKAVVCGQKGRCTRAAASFTAAAAGHHHRIIIHQCVAASNRQTLNENGVVIFSSVGFYSDRDIAKGRHVATGGLGEATVPPK